MGLVYLVIQIKERLSLTFRTLFIPFFRLWNQDMCRVPRQYQAYAERCTGLSKLLLHFTGDVHDLTIHFVCSYVQIIPIKMLSSTQFKVTVFNDN